MTSLAENLKQIKENISKAAKKSGRNLDNIILVAVTKQATVEQMKECLELGVKDIGENRVIVADEKFGQLRDLISSHLSFKKHMIGHLQTNKVKLAVNTFDVIQSVDSLKLAKEIDKRAKDTWKLISVFIEVNIGKEEQKSGVMPEDALSFYDKLIKFSNLHVEGLMCIAPLVSAEQTRAYFKQMKQLFDQLPLKCLSMGMSNDYVVAVEEGSNMVRIGSRLFGD